MLPAVVVMWSIVVKKLSKALLAGGVSSGTCFRLTAAAGVTLWCCDNIWGMNVSVVSVFSL